MECTRDVVVTPQREQLTPQIARIVKNDPYVEPNKEFARLKALGAFSFHVADESNGNRVALTVRAENLFRRQWNNLIYFVNGRTVGNP